MKPFLKYLSAVGAAVVALALVPAIASAEDPVERLVQMNKRALDDYDTLEWESAKRTLLEALVYAKKQGLETHPMMARTYVHLGAVYITGFKDKAKGQQSFARALEIDPSIKLTKGLATSELNQAFAQAQKGKGAGPATATRAEPPAAAPPPPPAEEDAPPPPSARKRKAAAASQDSDEEPDLPAQIAALDCPTPDEIPPDKAVTTRCAISPALSSKISSVYLFYREPGGDDYTSVAMDKSPKGWWVAKIPKKVVTGKTVQFYFEGRDSSGKPIVANGRPESPNIMLIVEGGSEAVASATGEDEEENPLEEREPTGPRLTLGKVDRSKIGLDTRYGNRRWWFGLGAGSGFGYAQGDGPEAVTVLKDYIGAGMAWAGVAHLAPEIGYQITPDVAIAVQGRHQYIPQMAKYDDFTARGAHSVLAKLMFFSKQAQSRLFGSVLLGGGEGFRFIFYPGCAVNNPNCGYSDIKDTIRGGPVVAGVGGGWAYELSKRFSFVLEANLLAGFPIFSVVLDGQMSLQMNFY